ncbi:hypothetical protein D3C75_988790 [compost metagenome]
MPLCSSNTGWFSGCIIAPMHWRATSRGSRVSVSRVMTKRTDSSGATSPTINAKRCCPLPRSNALSSASLPRLRSCPIHTCSVAFQCLGLCSRKNRSTWPSAYLWLSASISWRARVSSSASSGITSAGASMKSLSRAKCRLSSRLARKRTSRPSARASMSPALANIVGTATSVRASAGMPLL